MTAKEILENHVLSDGKLDRRLAAAYCGVSVVTIDRALANEEIGHYRVGRRILFDPSRHLEPYLQRGEVAAKEKTAGELHGELESGLAKDVMADMGRGKSAVEVLAEQVAAAEKEELWARDIEDEKIFIRSSKQ